MRKPHTYKPIIEKIFFDAYQGGENDVQFVREDIERAAAELKISLPKNLGDVVYSARYRAGLPESVLKTQPEGKEWIIQGQGVAKYAFRLVPVNNISPSLNLLEIKIPDATPEIVLAYSLTDEQAVLARVRYNRLIDIFLSCTAYSLQNHLRTTASGTGQIEIDELYVAVNKSGAQFVLPVQAKGGSDRLSTVQTMQDMRWCSEKYPHLICRSVSAQFMKGNVIAMFELTLVDEEVRVVQERHYRLVPWAEITTDDLSRYRAVSHE